MPYRVTFIPSWLCWARNRAISRHFHPQFRTIKAPAHNANDMEATVIRGARAVDRYFASQSGMITLNQLLESGVSQRTVRRMINDGSIVKVLPGIYRSAAWPMGRDQVMIAGCLRNPWATLAFTTAGQIHGLRKMQDDRVHLLVPHGSSPNLPGIVVHRCRRIDAEDIVELGDGRRITSVARTLFDVGAIIGGHRVRSALEQAIDRKMVTLGEVSETTLRLFHKKRPGSGEMKFALAAHSGWSDAVQSDLELRVIRAIQRHGLPTPRAQHELVVSDGSRIRFDFAWPHAKVALEVDHSFWHAGSDESRKDKKRDRLALAMGWTTIRLTEDDVMSGLDDVMHQVAAVLSRATGR